MAMADEIIESFRKEEKGGFFKSSRILQRLKKEKKYTLAEVVANLASHALSSIRLTGEFKVLEEIDRVIISGVGINHASALLARQYAKGFGLDIEAYNDYSLPESINKKTLVFIASYTGTDEEALASFRSAVKNGCRIIVLASGGGLLEAATRAGKEHIKLTKNIPESVSLFYTFFPVIKVLENSRILPAQKEGISEALDTLKKSVLSDTGYALAENLKNKIPIISSSSRFSSVISVWKAELNLIAGISSFTAAVPDIAHSDLAGFGNKLGEMHLVLIRDEQESNEIQKSVKTLKSVIKNQGYPTTEIMVKGRNVLTKMVSAAAIGMWAALELRGIYGSRGGEDLIAQYKKRYKEGFKV